MADTPINDAAEKAYAAASEKTVDAKPVTDAVSAKTEAPVTAKAEPVAAKPAVAKPAAAKSARAKPAAARAPVKRAAKPAKKVKASVKTAPKSVGAAKPKPIVAKTKTARKVAVKVAKPVSKPATFISKLKDTTMATTVKKTTEDFSSKIQGAMNDAQARAKTTFEKSQLAMGEMNSFSKGNLEAMVETGKVLANGMQKIGKNYVEEVKSALSTLQSDAKELTSVKSPKEFVELQSKLMRKYFDGVVAYNSKSAETALKLANEAFQPISSRVSLAVEKVRKAA